MTNTLADACNQIKNAERARKNEVIISPASKLLQRVLRIFQRQAYIDKF
jgi:ribosomal protein S8